MKRVLQMMVVAVLILGCAKSGQNSGLQIFDGKWGHLPSLRNTNPSSIFLIHQNKDENYDICIPEYMIQKYPGIRNEFEASINLWAHYIGRKVSVEFNVQALPEVTDPETTSLQHIESYYATCGSTTDLVIGEAFSDGSTLGFTQQSYSYYVNGVNGKHDVASFKRGLFLRKHKVGDPKKYNWISHQGKTGIEMSSEELLKMMIERKSLSFRKDEETYTTLPIIIHEIGHIWGLCDQYVLKDGATNCDSEFASMNEEGHVILDFDAQMSSAGWKEKLYLTEDDITGIRKLADRFPDSHWPNSDEYSKIAIAPLSPKPIELFKINKAIYDNETNKFIIDFAVDTNKPIEFKIQLKAKGARGLISYFPVKIDQPVSYSHYYMNLTIGKKEIEKVIVDYKVKESEESLTLEYTPEAPKENASVVEETITDETACESETCSS